MPTEHGMAVESLCLCYTRVIRILPSSDETKQPHHAQPAIRQTGPLLARQPAYAYHPVGRNALAGGGLRVLPRERLPFCGPDRSFHGALRLPADRRALLP